MSLFSNGVGTVPRKKTFIYLKKNKNNKCWRECGEK